MKKILIFWQNHGLTPLKNATFFTIWSRNFYSLKRLVLDLEHHQPLF